MRSLTFLVIVVALAAGSCGTCDKQCEPQKMCTIPDGLSGLDHDAAVAAIAAAGFYVHPQCHDGDGNDCHSSSSACYTDGWVVYKVYPESGSYPCGTVLDLTFVSPKEAEFKIIPKNRKPEPKR
jgi:hypothetical protein